MSSREKVRGILLCRSLAKAGAVHCPVGPFHMPTHTCRQAVSIPGWSEPWLGQKRATNSAARAARGVACHSLWHSSIFCCHRSATIQTQMACKAGNLQSHSNASAWRQAATQIAELPARRHSFQGLLLLFPSQCSSSQPTGAASCGQLWLLTANTVAT